MVVTIQEPSKYVGTDAFRNAFLRSIDEYNNYGVAATNTKYQMSHDTAVLLYGFKVSRNVVMMPSFCDLLQCNGLFMSIRL